jgi:HAD superfamily hydrolase (TIGR01549 family)
VTAVPTSAIDAALVDVDGTLVDSNYHHTLAWQRAFLEVGRIVETWRIHSHVGMGGDRLVAAVTDDEFEDAHGDEARAAWRRLADEVLDEIQPLPGATQLLQALSDRGLKVVLASSGPAEHVEHYIDLLKARKIADAWTTSDDVESTKPSPDLLQVAMDRVSAKRGFVIGDSTWDVVAASQLDLPAVTLRSGGFSEDLLTDAGAVEVFSTLPELTSALDRLLS